MSGKLYVRLAWTGIQKNKQLYLPYLVAGATMVMVFYIIDFLSVSDMVNHLHGGMAMTSILICGAWLIGVFSLPFLFYTNSALLKKRKREFGLYNILGMNKRNILMVLFLETFMTYGIVAVTGICMGILFSKIAELGLVNIMGQETDYHIYIEWRVVLVTVLLFAAVYFLIFLNAMRQFRNNNPIELLKSEAVGERPPKSRWLLVTLGVMFTASGYVMAIQIGNAQEGVEADAVLEGDFAVLCADLQKGVLDLSVDIMGKAPAKEGPEWNTYLQGFVMVRVMSLTDYNRMTQSEEKLGDREVLIAGGKSAKSVESVRSFDESEYTVVKTQESVPKFFGHQRSLKDSLQSEKQ